MCDRRQVERLGRLDEAAIPVRNRGWIVEHQGILQRSRVLEGGHVDGRARRRRARLLPRLSDKRWRTDIFLSYLSNITLHALYTL